MVNLPNVRQEQILSWLETHQTLTIEDLSSRLGVSVMTIHRDLDQLVETGVVQKVRGGVTLINAKQARSITEPNCRFCHILVNERTGFHINLQSGEQLRTCCPHCGLLLLDQLDQEIASALTKDFLYGRMVNVTQAIFLVGCELPICCVPSTLCFLTMEDASRFQQGFRGEVMTLQEAKTALARHHRTNSS